VAKINGCQVKLSRGLRGGSLRHRQKQKKGSASVAGGTLDVLSD